MKTCLIITPFYPFPKNRRLIKDTDVVYHLCKEKQKDIRIIILYYYQHTRVRAIKALFQIIRIKHYNQCLYKDDKGNSVLLFEHACVIPHRAKTFNIFDVKYAKILESYLRDNNITIDCAVVHFPSIFSDFIKKITVAKKIAIIHSFDIKNDINLKILRDNIGIYNKVGFRSIEIQRNYERNIGGSTKTFLCLSGIPQKFIKDMDEKKDWKNDKQFKIVFAGRLEKNKNVNLILKAIKLVKNNVSVQLNIIGGGKEKNHLKKMIRKLNISDNVNILGTMSRENVYEEMKKADMFIMVSFKETLGLTYLEAIAAGDLVIGTKNQGIYGLFDESEGCFFVDPYSSTELAHKIEYCFKLDEKIVNKMRENAKIKIAYLSDENASRNYISNIFE